MMSIDSNKMHLTGQVLVLKAMTSPTGFTPVVFRFENYKTPPFRTSAPIRLYAGGPQV